jgi:two-component system sensor histidine kinase QseC
MTSLRTRLFFILMIATGIVWTSAVAWIYLSTHAEVERVLDARLTEAARMVSSLITSQEADPRRAAQLPAGATILRTAYDRHLACQIWALDGTLVGRSDGAPAAPLTASRPGFSETRIDGELWRVYAIENKDLGMRVLVGDNLRVRDRLVGDVIKGLLLPASLIMPILAGLIWLCVRKGLAPLSRMAATLGRRDASDLSPLPDMDAPSEIRPVIKALNGLFGRVSAAREHERNFTAFAAHELRTPIAGLKTQAQVALCSDDAAIRRHALQQIAIGVDRTARLVRQLTDITAAEASAALPQSGETNVWQSLSLLADELAPHMPQGARVSLQDSLHGLWLRIEPGLFMLAARNLLENALLHSPPSGVVRCSATQDAGIASIIFDDDGPGIPEDELPRVEERFFRGRNKTLVGSGLGLAIVTLALSRAGGTLRLSNRTEGGLRAELRIARAAPAASTAPQTASQHPPGICRADSGAGDTPHCTARTMNLDARRDRRVPEENAGDMDPLHGSI